MFYKKKRKPRVFLGVHEVAGYYASLEQGLRDLGIFTTRLSTQHHKFSYSKLTLLERHCQWLHRKYPTLTVESRWHRFLQWYVPWFEKMLIKFIIYFYDVFIYSFMTSLDGSLTNMRGLADLELIHAKRKTIICVFHGSEIRPPWLNGIFADRPIGKIKSIGKQTRNRLAIIEKYADAIVSLPSISLFQRKPFLSYLAIGVPLRKAHSAVNRIKWTQVVKPYEVGVSRTRILHAPSNPQYKGSIFIEAAISELVHHGHLIDYIRVENMAHAEVQKQLEIADFVIDQIYSDTPMAHFAAEAAMQGCPAIVCGLELKRLAGVVPTQHWPPSLVGPPSALHDNILKLIENPELTRSLGLQAYEFVTQNWAASVVANKFLDVARGKADHHWYFDPKKNSYFFGGYGMSDSTRIELIKSAIANVGIPALGLPKDVRIDDVLRSVDSGLHIPPVH